MGAPTAGHLKRRQIQRQGVAQGDLFFLAIHTDGDLFHPIANTFRSFPCLTMALPGTLMVYSRRVPTLKQQSETGNSPMKKTDLASLVRRHRLLDTAITPRRDQFLSDWNCENPFFDRLLGPKLLDLATERQSGGYIYFDDDRSILQSICDFHLRCEGLKFSRSSVIAGPGSSSFLAVFSLWLRKTGITDICYLPPLYHTFHFLLDTLDISVRPVSQKHAFEAGCTLELPFRRTALLLCDPIWYAGKPVPDEHIGVIADWQRKTGSIVFVDGSFQYMKWAGNQGENTALFDPELTFRLICPAKALAIPFYRFAYLLHPEAAHADLLFLYESVIGGASVADLTFAHRALQVLGGDADSRLMPDYFRTIYLQLLERKLISTRIVPECGYFVFAVPSTRPPDEIVMDQSYFELEGYPDHCRVNLMAARRIYLLPF